MRPFASVGAGGKGANVFGGAFKLDFTALFGGGVSLPVSRVFEVRFSARDHVSSFDNVSERFPGTGSSPQHDVYLLGGASLHL
ncbi:MAG: hypothetical protein ACE5HQ_03300 [Gemmatimonadota bacterium]